MLYNNKHIVGFLKYHVIEPIRNYFFRNILSVWVYFFNGSIKQKKNMQDT